MHIAICDDEPRQAQALHDAVTAWARERDLPCQAEVFPNGEALWFACEGNDLYSILLLDVEMPGISGMELARCLRSSGSRAEIVFVTSHFELAGEGYEVDALHYLVKPVAAEKLFAVLDKAADRLAAEPNGVVITSGGETVKLYESDILYAESFRHDLVIHTKTAEYRIKENISDFAARLSPDFYRAHRSYVVNLKAVRRIARTGLTLEGGAEIPLARGKYDEVHRAFIDRN